MTGLLTSVSLAVLLGWTVFALSGIVLPTLLAAYVGTIVGLALVLIFRTTIGLNGLVAVLEPIGIILPLLALRHVAGSLGLSVGTFSAVELLAFLILYVAFLATAFGVIPLEPYRLGYAPVPVAVMVLALCAYGALTGNIFVPLVAVLGQFLWIMGWGSSNWFDHVLHVMLVPVVLVVLVGRLF